jgi:hypothetical protein
MRGESYFCNHATFAAPFFVQSCLFCYRVAYICLELPLLEHCYNGATSGLGHVEVDWIAHAQFHNSPSDSEPVTSLSCCRIWTVNDNRAVM